MHQETVFQLPQTGQEYSQAVAPVARGLVMIAHGSSGSTNGYSVLIWLRVVEMTYPTGNG
jgi:hypothetical protein